MPELPEVEVARRCLSRWAQGQPLRRVVVHDPRIVDGDLEALVGARFIDFDRRGKNLLITLRRQRTPIGLWSHLGMTGKWLLRAKEAPAPRFSRAELHLPRGQVLHYADMRLLGVLAVIPKADFASVPALAALGRDPLVDGLSGRQLALALSRARGPIKVALMDQRNLAGIGNIQASEALFRARLHPARATNQLSPDEQARLAGGIRASIEHTLKAAGIETLEEAERDVDYVEEPGTDNPFRVYGREGEPCPRCRGPIQRVVQAGRSTFFCGRCQPATSRKSDRRARGARG